MKKILLVLLILLTVGCGVKDNNQEVDELTNIINENNYIIVDVRTKEEYDEGHVKGALNIPVDTIDEKVDLDKDKTIIVYCRSGARSSKAQGILEGLGYQVYNSGAYDSLSLEKE